MSYDLIKSWGIQCSSKEWTHNHLHCIDSSGESRIKAELEFSQLDIDAATRYQVDDWKQWDFEMLLERLLIACSVNHTSNEADVTFLEKLSMISVQFDINDISIETKCILRILNCSGGFEDRVSSASEYIGVMVLRSQLVGTPWMQAFQSICNGEMILTVEEFVTHLSRMLEESRTFCSEGKIYGEGITFTNHNSFKGIPRIKKKRNHRLTRMRNNLKPRIDRSEILKKRKSDQRQYYHRKKLSLKKRKKSSR